MSMQNQSTMEHRWQVSPGNYFISRRVAGGNFDEVKARVSALLKEQGFGILTTIDVAQTMKEKLGEDLARYEILGACNPPLALRALREEPGVGALLPCNVVIAQEDDGIFVGSVDPESMFSVVGNEPMRALAREVKARLEQALSGLAS